MFKAGQDRLGKILDEAGSGKLQLPDFQRGWVWDDERIRGLLASVSRGFPIGVIMTLQASSEVKFKPRPIEGADENEAALEDYLLDGQQRITSLYQAIYSKNPVQTKDSNNRSVSRHYYIDMAKSLDAGVDREDAILSVPENRIITRNFGREIVLDLSNPEKEYQARTFPIDQIFNDSDWMIEFIRYWTDNSAEIDSPPIEFWKVFKDSVIKHFLNYDIPVIRMTKETPKEAVCTVFEKVNTGGVPLTVFELVTASFAAERKAFSLRDDLEKDRLGRMRKFGILDSVTPDQFLQAVALLATQKKWRKNEAPGVGCRRRDILNLSLAEYDDWADKVEEGFIEAAKFLKRQRIYMSRDIPYGTQLVPLAALHVEMEHELESSNALSKLERWFWCGVFGRAYGSAVETQFSLDLRETAEYIRGGPDPKLVQEATFTADILLSLRTRRSAAYKGVYALQMKNEAADWRSGKPITDIELFDDNIDIHHIFPVNWFKKHHPGVDSKIYNSIINKTPIDAKTNRSIGGNAPSQYLDRLAAKDIESETLDAILKKHWIDPECLRADNFAEFFVTRGQELLDLIGNAMGKKLVDGTETFSRAVNEANYIDDYIDDD